MYPLFYSLLLVCCLLSCSNPSTSSTAHNLIDTTSSNTLNNSSTLFQEEEDIIQQRRQTVFTPLLDSASREDSIRLKTQLIQQYQLADLANYSPLSCKSSRLHGYLDSVWLLQFYVLEDSLCLPFGRQRQFIFDAQGHLLFEDSAAQISFLSVWDNTPPLLMTLNSNCQQEGKHHFYRWQEGHLIDIFNVIMDSSPITFDANERDFSCFYPEILELTIEDINKDGWNDLHFKGERLKLKDRTTDRIYPKYRPFKKDPISHIFLFDPGTESFVEQNKSNDS